MPQEIKRKKEKKKKKKKKPTFTQKKKKKEKEPTLPKKTIGGIFVHLTNHTLSLCFLPILERKQLGPITFFSSPLPNQTPSKKFSVLIFIFFFFFLIIIFFSSSLKSTLLNTPLKTVWIKEKMRVSGEK